MGKLAPPSATRELTKDATLLILISVISKLQQLCSDPHTQQTPDPHTTDHHTYYSFVYNIWSDKHLEKSCILMISVATHTYIHKGRCYTNL